MFIGRPGRSRAGRWRLRSGATRPSHPICSEVGQVGGWLSGELATDYKEEWFGGRISPNCSLFIYEGDGGVTFLVFSVLLR